MSSRANFRHREDLTPIHRFCKTHGYGPHDLRRRRLRRPGRTQPQQRGTHRLLSTSTVHPDVRDTGTRDPGTIADPGHLSTPPTLLPPNVAAGGGEEAEPMSGTDNVPTAAPARRVLRG
ncbi:hypothetical protein THAOC_27633, partial [Thalassiosira oceanica]